MIKYNNNTINDWYYGASNLIKVYRNNAIVFYKVSGESPTPEYKVCYAVVDDISQYSETEFEDVYDKATEKWYKLNNLNKYEEYGIYGSGRTICEGSSRLPQGYTEVEYIENTSTAYIDTGAYLDTSNFEIGYVIGNKQQLFGYCHQGCGSCTWLGVEQSATMWWGNFNNNANLSSYLTSGDNTIIFTQSGATINGTSISKTLSIGSDDIRNSSLLIFARYDFRHNVVEHRTDSYMQVKSFYLKNNGTLVRDFVPAKRDSDDKYGMYDLITDTFYVSPNNVDFSGGDPITPTDCVTTYDGKLTIDDGYEYEWNGSSWVNVGEVSGSSRVPSGYVELTHAQTIKQAVQMQSGFTVPIDLQATYNYIFEFTPIDWESNTGSYYGALLGVDDSDTNFPSYGLFKLDNGWGTMWNRTISSFWNYSFDTRSGKPASGKYRFYDDTKAKVTMHLHNYDASQGADMIVENEGYPTSAVTSTSAYKSGYVVSTGVHNLPLFSSIDSQQNTAYMNFYNLKIETNENVAVYDYIPCKRKSDNKVGLYDVVHNVFYAPLFELNAGDEASHTEYPKYYTEKSDPLNDLTFNTMAEAQTYAYNNCVYDGMKATIDGDRYYFDSEDENGWVKILEYYKVEDVTPSGGSGWTISGSSTYNPDSTYYDDFDLEATSTSNVTKIAKITIYGYDHFTYYLRTSGYSNYCYAVATNVDEIQTPPASMSYNSSSAITNTYYWGKSPKSPVNLSNYRRVTYNNLDKTVEHTFYVYFYGRTYLSNVGNATILIPKDQTNENWEQVTFSSSTNVSGTTKSLYIDGNYSNSGGTQYWYYRWIVGLPSGSHSSYTNYSNYNYCPNTTSSTFTSVAGEQRQVNFTYDGTTDKNLSFRLTDGSNVLTPSNSVYYGMTLYNSCGVSVSTVLTFPIISFGVKVGGSFSFSNSSNRHYIYGYQPPTLGTRYYVDNYQSTFDIVYTKLSEEAVTITYTTYDPNDVEIPAFNTDITYPYSGGTTSSTTLTSFDVPYTYPYTVKQTNDKFSADSQSYTANQAARTINFTLYPNNYAYAWEGMKATVGDTKYQYKNGEWVENQHSLPDVPFVLNYNARQYNASTYTIPYTEGALNAIDAVITGETANIIDHSSDGYIQLTGSTSTPIRALVGTTNFSRSSSSPNITIICKAYTPSSSTEGNILSNRKESYNWMYRHKSSYLTFHGTSEQGSIAVSNTEPNTCSVRIDSSRLLRYNNWTQNTTSTYSNFNYGSNSNGGALFAGYYSASGEMWKGVFYWIYMTLNTLTDEQVQQVIDYNENL